MIFNENNTAHLTAEYPIFLGQAPALYDSINKVYPQLFELYKLLKAQDWSENEINLDQSRRDFESCDKSTYDVMVQTLMWQWEADSIASRSIATLFAPFISNSEYSAAVMRHSDNEILHALTYSEIVRQCIKDSKGIIREVMDNQNVLKRSTAIISVFEELEKIGSKYRLGESFSPDYLRRVLLKGVCALYALEGIEFMASFACTFALAEQNMFMGIGQLVQKIQLDEVVHTKIDKTVLEILLADQDWKVAFSEIKPEIKAILDEVVEQEQNWANYIFSNGRAIVGLNTTLLTEWVYYKALPIYTSLGIDWSFPVIQNNPLPWMEQWINIDQQQNANQEQDNNAYKLNVVVDDLGDIIINF